MLTPDTYALAERLFHEAKDLPHEAWTEFLAARCADDSEALRFVRQLLETHRAAGSAEGEPLDSLPLYEIPGYRIVRPLGTGGMGVVYLARQEHPPRNVALKLVKPACLRGDFLRRFEFEATALARLHHPGIAAIYDAGTVETSRGRLPYFAMEYVEGETLLRFADANNLLTSARLQLLAGVCGAVHHAHLHGVVHRDLKPANILVTSEPVPKILDFGLARSLECDVQATFATLPGQIAGTLQYMSPEQTYGDSKQIDLRTDIYSLGVIAYELLAGRPPYKLDPHAPFDAIHVIRDGEPIPLSTVSRMLGGDIAAVVGKALSKEKQLRYDSAAALRDDVVKILENKPVVARRPSAVYRLRKFVRRNRAAFAAAVAGASLMFLLSITAAIYVLWLPGWVERHIRAARLQLLNPMVGELIYMDVNLEDAIVHRGRWHEAADAIVPRYQAALREYDTVLWALVGDRDKHKLQNERDTVAIALGILEMAIERSSSLSMYDAQRPIGGSENPPEMPHVPGKALTTDTAWVSSLHRLERAGPLAAHVAARWLQDSTERTSLDGRIGDATQADLRCLGLLAFLCGSTKLCHEAWVAAGTTISDPPDALVDAALGEVHLMRGEVAPAFTRLDRAVRAFPNVGFLLTDFADAAIQGGDLPAAKIALDRMDMLLDHPNGKDSFDPFDTHRRIRADFFAVRDEPGDAQRAESEYRWLLGNRQSGTIRLNYARFLAKHGRLSDAVAVLHELVRSRRGFSNYEHAFVYTVETWWAATTLSDRVGLLGRAMDLHPANSGSLVALLRDYCGCAPLGTCSASQRELPQRKLEAIGLGELSWALEVYDVERWAKLVAYPRVIKNLQLLFWLGSMPSQIPSQLRNTIGRFATAPSGGSGTKYELHDLGTLGGPYSVASGINQQGYVVGHAAVPDAAGLGMVPFVWSPEPEDTFRRGMQAVPVNAKMGEALAINDSGSVVGWLNQAGHHLASLWKGGKLYALPTPRDRPCGFAHAVNNADVAAGWVTATSPDALWVAAMWSHSSVTLLGTLGGDQSAAMDIDDQDRVVGWARSADGNRHAFLWTHGSGMVDLGTGTWPESVANALNEKGIVVGAVIDERAGRQQACRWKDGMIQQLDVLHRDRCTATGINSAGIIVGTCRTPVGSYHAYMWSDSDVVDLNNLIPGQSGWELSSACAISNRGEIAGNGYIGTETHAFLLSPVGEPWGGKPNEVQ